MPSPIEIQVAVRRVFYHQNDWCIMRTSIGNCKGLMSWKPIEDERLRLTGAWVPNAQFGGDDFVFRTVMPDVDLDPRDELAYAVELTKGFGPTQEQAIWATFGDQWKGADVTKVKGISARLQGRWVMTLEKLRTSKAMSDTVAFLMGHKCSSKMAAAAWARWNTKAVKMVKDDCYCLTDLPHYGFRAVDTAIRQTFGIGDEDPRRFDASLVYTMKQQTESGDTLANAESVRGMMINFTGTDQLDESLARCDKVVTVNGTHLALRVDYDNETRIKEFFEKNGTVKNGR